MIRQDLADAITEYLLQRYGMRRPPVSASRTLAFICELYQRHMPFPKREEAKQLLGCSIFAMDAAISVYIARGELAVEMRTIPSVEIKQRQGIVRQRFYIPSQALIDLSRMHHGTGRRRA